jgi:hypothetical protein
MYWFQAKAGRLAYRGRLTRGPFDEWLQTREGAAMLETAAAQSGFRLFAASRTRKRLWRALERAARTEPVRTALQGEAEWFAKVLGQVCYAPALPRTQVALHRLVIVPRALVAARARTGVRLRLWNLPALAGVDEAVRTFLCEQVLVELDRALERASPTAARRVEAAEGWSCVGAHRPYVWVDPLWAGAEWSGHLFMFEFPRTSLSSTQRNELDGAVKHLQNGLTALSRPQRDAIVRRAADGLATAHSR